MTTPSEEEKTVKVVVLAKMVPRGWTPAGRVISGFILVISAA